MTHETPLLSETEHAQVLKRRTYKAILEFSARHPLLNPGDIALMLGASEGWVRKVMKSDSFLAQRAARVEELFGPQLQEIRAKMMETTSLLLDSVAKRIANPDASVTEDTLLKALTLLLDRIVPAKQPLLPAPSAPASPSANVLVFNGISQDDMIRARNRHLSHGAAIDLEPQTQPRELTYVDADGIPTERRVRSNEGLD